MYAKVVKIVKNRKELTEELLEQLEECVMDSAKAKAIIDASKSSMGLFYFFKIQSIGEFNKNSSKSIHKNLI